MKCLALMILFADVSLGIRSNVGGLLRHVTTMAQTSKDLKRLWDYGLVEKNRCPPRGEGMASVGFLQRRQ